MSLSLVILGWVCTFLLQCASIVAENGPVSQILTRNPDDYRLRYRDPRGCDPNTCHFFMGIDTNTENKSYLDIYLVGQVKGWVALGFSETDGMLFSDVVGCSMYKEGTLLIVDSYNPKTQRHNVMDDSELATNGSPEDIIEHSKEYTDGRIICTFSRLIKGIDPYPQDLILNSSYYLQFGLGHKGRDSENITYFPYHGSPFPSMSNKKYNPLTDSANIGINTLKDILIATHGILMLVTWPMLSFTAILFATWMKPALPNGQWFQVHRAFNVASLLVGATGFILVFIAHKDESTPGLIDLGKSNIIGTAHFAVGLLMMTLHIVNPIISIFRCKPDKKLRWIFIILHGLILGYGVQTLAYVNVGLGVYVYSMKQTDFGNLTLLWIYLGFAIFSVVLACLLFAVFTGEAIVYKSDVMRITPSVVKIFWQCCIRKTENLMTKHHMDRDESSPLIASKHESTNTDPLIITTHKIASRDAPLRWLGLVAFLLVMVPTVIVLSILMIIRIDYD